MTGVAVLLERIICQSAAFWWQITISRGTQWCWEDSTLGKAIFQTSLPAGYVCSSRNENITRVWIEDMFNTYKVLTPMPLRVASNTPAHQSQQHPLYKPSQPAVYQIISTTTTTTKKNFKKSGFFFFFCSICKVAVWELSSDRSLALVFGKHTQRLVEIGCSWLTAMFVPNKNHQRQSTAPIGQQSTLHTGWKTVQTWEQPMVAQNWDSWHEASF